MNKRKNDNLNRFLLNEKELKIYRSLLNKLDEYIALMNRLFETKNIKYSIIIINASEKSIKETRSYIRNTDIFLKVPYMQHYYILLLQNTECKSAVEFGSRLTSLINRNFMLHKKNISHKIALISFNTTPPTAIDVCYEILNIIKKFKNDPKNDYWVEIKRL